MLRVVLLTLHADKLEVFKDWMSALRSRKEEVLETFEAEGVKQEFVAIIGKTDPPVVVWAVESEDLAGADEAFKNSRFAVDVEHKAVLNECIAGRAGHEVLLNLRARP